MRPLGLEEDGMSLDYDLDLYAPLAEPEPPLPRVCGTCAECARLVRLDGSCGLCCTLEGDAMGIVEEVEYETEACDHWRD